MTTMSFGTLQEVGRFKAAKQKDKEATHQEEDKVDEEKIQQLPLKKTYLLLAKDFPLEANTI